MRFRLFHPSLFAALLFAPLLEAAEWPLQSGAFEICLPEAPSPSEQFAAEELQTYFRKMNGVEIAIRKGQPEKKAILLGRHSANRKLWERLDNPDFHLLEGSPEQLQIVGGFKPALTSAANGRTYAFDWGVLYGVYQFLEDQGVRWFRPEPDGEEVPRRTALTIPEGSHAYTPGFAFRWGAALYATPNLRTATEEETQWARLWALRNRANVTNLADPKYGGGVQIGGAGHSYDYLVPKRLFDEHPDFFPLIDGKRVPKGQRCHGNPALQEYFAEAVIAAANANPQWMMTSIDPNDGGGWCECQLCTAMDDPGVQAGHGNGLSMASRVNTFNNIIAAKVAEKHPHLLLYCLAYAQYTEAPTRVPKLHDNLIIGLAPFAGTFSDYSRPMRDPESKPNSRFLKSIQDYHKLGATMYAREYLSYYIWPGPLPLLTTMQDRLNVYKEYGFKGVYSETHPCWGPQGINLYFYWRLLWDPQLDLKAALRDYCEKFYGPAAEPMQRYHELLEERGTTGPYFGSGGSHAHNLFTPEFLASLRPFVEEAERLAKGHAPYEWRTETTLAGYQFAVLYRKAVDAIRAGEIATAKKAVAELDVFYSERYPKGDVFDKGDGRARKDKNGEPIPPSFLRDLRNDLAKVDTYEKTFANPRLLQSFQSGWKFNVDPANDGLNQKWEQAGLEDSEWPRIESGKPWQHQGYSHHTGTAWYRRQFPTPKLAPGKRLILVFDGADGDTTVWLNGREVGRHELINPVTGKVEWDDPFSFDVTDFQSADGLNALAIRVRKENGNGGLHRHVKLISADAPPPEQAPE